MEVEPASCEPLLFADVSDDDLLSYGVPLGWLDEVGYGRYRFGAGRPSAE